MLFLAVPDAGQGDKGGRHGAFPETEEEADGGEAGEVIGGGQAEADDAPDDTASGVSLEVGDVASMVGEAYTVPPTNLVRFSRLMR